MALFASGTRNGGITGKRISLGHKRQLGEKMPTNSVKKILTENIAKKFIDAYCEGDEFDLTPYRSIRAMAAAILTRVNDYYDGFDDIPVDLNLFGITSITEDAAQNLARVYGNVNLPGLKVASEDVIKAFAGHQGGLSLGIRSCSAESAKALSTTKPFSCVIDTWEWNADYMDYFEGMTLDGIESLDDDAAYHLSRHASSWEFFIHFSGTQEEADVTQARDRELFLKILEKIQWYADPTSDLYADREEPEPYLGQKLGLMGLRNISDTAAMHLSRHFGPIEMRLDFTQLPETEGYLALKKKLEDGYSVPEKLARALGVNF